MRIVTTFVRHVLPVIQHLSVEEKPQQWNDIGQLQSLAGVLANGRVVEENDRPLRLEEWSSLWTDAIHGQTNKQLGMRQRFMYDNMRTAVRHLNDLSAVLNYLEQNSESLGVEVERRVKENLPVGAVLPNAITMILGTTSSGYVNDEGIFIDLVTLYMFHDDKKMIKDLLTHESWHFGHSSLLESHPNANEPWFLPVAQLQSEGIVNYIVGGTYQINQHRAQHSEDQAREESRRFVEYVDSFNTVAQIRLNELLSSLEKLLSGDLEGYMKYVRTLPDIPGYLHGVFMSRQIEAVFGREVLVQSASDPVKFILLSVDALKSQGFLINVSDETLQFWSRLCR
ncbi:DUF5700 domain-containing putative Zn-dependent protease [Alicyclobacillus mengziensis]|uniref:Uncharacterized protein n=1 Tax=Alicyclobacillus mengziensis TaxID=2931921 RepID=A0A9X7Z5X7_9BACL|nr:DUF5700 domain-containing putative Zn-dependent protease [Alicyclobacillus mengziensis]QSO47359.1 hypothetical protein JZ786_23725 [Alicyclobacillus mengziensis]